MIKLLKLSIFAALLISIVIPTQHSSALSTNNFSISNYQINYNLSKNSQGNSTLKTEEKIDAVFPDTDQNHGIERSIPTTFDGHPTNLGIVSVTDGKGNPLNYVIYESNGNKIVRIGNADQYVHGLQSYDIIYNQVYVTKYYANTNDDEFYWDTNGTGWAVPINSLKVNLQVDNNLASTLNNKQSCYIGQSGSTTKCDISVNGNNFTTSATNLNPYDDLTISVGFAPHTFTPYKETTTQKIVSIYIILFFITIPISVLILIIFLIVRYRKSNRLSEINTIIPEYTVPADTSVSTSATILGKTNKLFTAQLIDLAIRKYLKIYQIKEKTLLGTADYEIEIIKDISDLKEEEQEFIRDIYGTVDIGTKIDMDRLKNNNTVKMNMMDNKYKLETSLIDKYGLKTKSGSHKGYIIFSVVILVLSIPLLSPALFLISIFCITLSLTMKTLTDKGVGLLRYLKGLEMYIKVAEEDRIKMLQSPEGAEKVGSVDPEDKKKLVILYEKVLPYAILFGQEKDWNKQLGIYYETTNYSPYWYQGYGGAFNAALFAESMNNFNQTATFANPTNSNMGGSGGGGFAGGGGGGGGGGGW